MDPVSPLPAFAALSVAVATSFVLANKFGEPAAPGRFASIDGLRGFLAFFVFLHHACIWYFYLRTDTWNVPPSNLYTHFGQSSVALFFMITGFLFFSKLINGRTQRIDWGRLFVSRFLRLVPLYLFVICILFLVVSVLSNGTLNVPFPKLVTGMLKWLLFTLPGAPDLNGIDHTATIVAGVTWSLPYEWIFYCSLPMFALTVGVVPPLKYRILGIVTVAVVALHPSGQYLPFLGGIVAAFLVRLDFIRRWSAGAIASCVALACLTVTVAAFPTAYAPVPLFLLTVFFVLIASGNSLFGFLLTRTSRTLGEFSYSIYLMHGLILFIAFNFIVGLAPARTLSVLQHWTIILGITPVLVFVCFLTYRFIEHPPMQKTNAAIMRLRSLLKRPMQDH